MEKLIPCPFCGSEKIAIDTLKGYKRTLFRGQCQKCHSATAWKETEGQAAADWNTRSAVFKGQQYLPDCLMGKNRFQFEGNAYEHDPRSGYCYCFIDPLNPQGRNDKWRRMAQADYETKYKACSAKLAETGGKL
jgi:Lar family restriction alleviation protein